MADGTFREDFYFRLSVVELNLPPLRERDNDIDFIANSFLKRFGSEAGNPSLKFGKTALDAIRTYPWTGNVRELQNRVRRAAIMTDGNTVSVEDLQLPAKSSHSQNGSSLKEAKESLEREMVVAAMKKHKGKITAAASELGISRPTFYEMLDRLGIERN